MKKNQAEKFRPQIHITPPKGYLNDPNGLVFFNDEYHVFYQLYPHGVEGAIEKHWAHAVSTDLVRFKQRGNALSPDKYGSIWSGSCIVDEHNVSGLFDSAPQKRGILAYYTSTGMTDISIQRQCMAYSFDGCNFIKYNDGRPIIEQADDPANDNDFRDPKVFWYERGKRFLMVTAGGPLRIFSSYNLIDWKAESYDKDIRTECPDLFCLKIDGQEKWILSGCGEWYMLGDLIERDDKIKFLPDTGERLPFNFGSDKYASQVFSNKGERIIKIDWVCGNFNAPEYAKLHDNIFVGALSLPYELSLIKVGGKIKLIQKPIAELASLRNITKKIDKLMINSESIEFPLSNFDDCYELVIDIDTGTAERTGIKIHSDGQKHFTSIAYDKALKKLIIDRANSYPDLAPFYNKTYLSECFELCDNILKLHVFVDGPIVEVFTQDGLQVATVLSYSKLDTQKKIEFFADNGNAAASNIILYRLKV